jgi:hypothetical protein
MKPAKADAHRMQSAEAAKGAADFVAADRFAHTAGVGFDTGVSSGLAAG